MTYRDFLKDLEGQKLYHFCIQGIHTLTKEKHIGYIECTLLRVEDDFVVFGFAQNGKFSRAARTLYTPITSVHCEFPEEKR